MTKLFEVPYEGGTIVFAANDGTGAAGYAASGVLQKAEQSLDDALDMAKSLGTALKNKLSEIECNHVEATFGLKLSGKGQFIVAEASAEASIEVKLSFTK